MKFDRDQQLPQTEIDSNEIIEIEIVYQRWLIGPSKIPNWSPM
jgi:hypothetical protein